MNVSQVEPETTEIKIEKKEIVKTQSATITNDLLNHEFDSCLPELDLQVSLFYFSLSRFFFFFFLVYVGGQVIQRYLLYQTFLAEENSMII